MESDKELTPLNLADITPRDWYEITADECDRKYITPLVAKKNMAGRYQAGVKTSACRWRWSVTTYATAEEAEQEARRKADELKNIMEAK